MVAVGAYNARLMTYAPFSGRGYTRGNTQVKPDIVAPGVDIVTTAVGGSYTGVTGTSFATPFVTGAAAIMMQYGIVQGMIRFFMERRSGHICKEVHRD